MNLSMQMAVLVAAACLCLADASPELRLVRKQQRPTRGFRPGDLMTARGFGKRDSPPSRAESESPRVTNSKNIKIRHNITRFLNRWRNGLRNKGTNDSRIQAWWQTWDSSGFWKALCIRKWPTTWVICLRRLSKECKSLQRWSYQIYIQVTNAVIRIQTKGVLRGNSNGMGDLVLRAVLASEIPRKPVWNVSIVCKRLTLKKMLLQFRTAVLSALFGGLAEVNWVTGTLIMVPFSKHTNVTIVVSVIFNHNHMKL